MIHVGEEVVTEKRPRGRPRKTPVEPTIITGENKLPIVMSSTGNEQTINVTVQRTCDRVKTENVIDTVANMTDGEVHVQIMNATHLSETPDECNKFITIEQCDLEATGSTLYTPSAILEQNGGRFITADGSNTATLVMDGNQVMSGNNSFMTTGVNGATQYVELVAAENADGTTQLCLQSGEQVFTSVPTSVPNGYVVIRRTQENELAGCTDTYFDTHLV